MGRNYEGLRNLLIDILGTNRVYFQAPSNHIMEYPCIRFALSAIDEKFANNHLYLNKKQYIITVIDTDPDSPIPDKVGQLELTKFNKFYAADNLNHFVYMTYY